MSEAEKQLDQLVTTDPWRQLMAAEIEVLKQGCADAKKRDEETRKLIDENTRVTMESKAKIDDVYDILETIKGGIKSLGWLANAVKWVGVIAGGVSAIWILVYQWQHGGEMPTGKHIDMPK